MEVKPSDVRLAGMDLLARREHSSQEIITKLKKRFGKRLESDAVIHDAVDQLTREGLLSDQRYAASMARQLVNYKLMFLMETTISLFLTKLE